MHHHPTLQPLLDRQRRLQIRLLAPIPTPIPRRNGVGPGLGGEEEKLLDAEEGGEVPVEVPLLAAGRRPGGDPDLLWWWGGGGGVDGIEGWVGLDGRSVDKFVPRRSTQINIQSTTIDRPSDT